VEKAISAGGSDRFSAGWATAAANEPVRTRIYPQRRSPERPSRHHF